MHQAVEIGCSACGDDVEWSAPADVVLLWFPATEKPVTVTLGGEVHVCLACDAVTTLFNEVELKLPSEKTGGFHWMLGRACFRDGYSLIARNPQAEVVATA